MTKILTIQYDGNDASKHIINNEDEDYYYFIDGWTGEKKRLHKEKNYLEFEGLNGQWIRFTDWQKYIYKIKRT
jgi:hypothetical protein